ncbi:MAG: thioesterase family protein [Chloroflexi bacterium]|nr:thioesterase family protein [Chloroflexota bacterium]
MTDAIFIPDGDMFVPTPRAGSPWGAGLLHGGPPAGLLARAIERFAGTPEMQVTRLTVDLFRPVPAQPLRVETRSVRAGNRIHAVEASLFAGDTEVTRASGLLLRTTDLEISPPRVEMPPGPEGIETGSMQGGPAWRGPRPENMPQGFHTTIEVRWAPRADAIGPAFAWIRVPVPFVAGEATSPLVHIASISDFGSAFSGMSTPGGSSYINADITLYLHRLPAGDWIGLQAERRAEPNGLGVASAVLYDADGPVGRTAHAQLANQRR